ncbi:hypothetical protein M427DRAFT_301448 [Gonapodya prolifera JEL478]|uniref:Calcineurin-like phosphoesterase domain-containing protein n=1 Tax=Gonapodya prolifera (strain JEL478) TaxID=1344416 RepID=A0A139AHG5_GONPJ|nr:hypothetical protein M427DRAFT_301448 [Gonapodya prolifera JEL478]|eukprot:KXS16129.1 hypothetical protein M427DRAFT_301448 [Gonapodya prolifera JEL478]
MNLEKSPLTIVLSSDLHGNLKHVESLVALTERVKADLLILAGDLQPRMSALGAWEGKLVFSDSPGTWEILTQRKWAEQELWPRLAKSYGTVVVGWGNHDLRANDEYHKKLLQTHPTIKNIHIVNSDEIVDIPLQQPVPFPTSGSPPSTNWIRVYGKSDIVAGHRPLKERERVDCNADLLCRRCYPQASTATTTSVRSFPSLRGAPHVCWTVATSGLVTDPITLKMVPGDVPMDPASTLESTLGTGFDRLESLRGTGAHLLSTPSDLQGTGKSRPIADGLNPNPIATLAIFHHPPYGTCLDRGGGSQAVRGFLTECATKQGLVDLAVSGHYHDAAKRTGKFAEVIQVKGTNVVWTSAGENGAVDVESAARDPPIVCFNTSNEYHLDSCKAIVIRLERRGDAARRVTANRVAL